MDAVGAQKVNPNKRVCAILADFLLILLLNFLLFTLFKITATGIIGSFLNFLLLVFRDAYRGQSPGKMFVGLRAVDLNGNPISFAASFKRNIILFWIMLLDPFFPNVELDSVKSLNIFTSSSIAISVIWFLMYVTEYFVATRSKDGRRIGDMIAGTKVIDLHPQRPNWIYAISGAVILIILFALPYFISKLYPQ